MIRKLFARCAEWATRWRDKLRADPFRYARLETAALYLVVGFVIIVAMDYFVDSAIREAMYSIAINDTGESVRAALSRVNVMTWVSRGAKLLMYAVSIYFITGFSMRHIRRSTQLQRRFVATASHELKTPLAVMKSATEVALRQKESLTREKGIYIIEENLAEVDRLSRLVQFLIDFSKLEHNQGRLMLERTDAAAATARVLPLFEASAAEKGVGLLYKADAECIVYGNTTALEQIVANLVKNALASTPSGGHVEVSVAGRSNWVTIEIVDTGVGIARRNFRHIFEPFYRGDPDRASPGAGMGLGLSIVREFVHAMHGTIALQSVEGQGSRFTITLKGYQP